eukprot:gene10059-biopygen7244
MAYTANRSGTRSRHRPLLYTGTAFDAWDIIMTAKICGMISDPLCEHTPIMASANSTTACLTIIKHLDPVMAHQYRYITNPLIMLEHIRSDQCSTSDPQLEYSTAFTAHTSSTSLIRNWILETGATNHMTGNPDLLYDIRSVKSILVRIAAGDITITRVGSTCIQGDRGNIITLRKVYLTDSKGNTQPSLLLSCMSGKPHHEQLPTRQDLHYHD